MFHPVQGKRKSVRANHEASCHLLDEGFNYLDESKLLFFANAGLTTKLDGGVLYLEVGYRCLFGCEAAQLGYKMETFDLR